MKLFEIEQGTKEICNCNYPNYKIDITNRTVRCIHCGKFIDIFQAISKLSLHIEELEEKAEKYNQIEKILINENKVGLEEEKEVKYVSFFDRIPVEKEDIIKLEKQGYSLQEIAELYECSVTTIKNRLKE